MINNESSRVDDVQLSRRLIYEESVVARNQKFNDLVLMNEKFNWILVSNIVFFTVIAQLIGSNGSLFIILAGVSNLASTIYCLLGIKIQDYESGPTHKRMSERLESGKDYATMLKEITAKIEDDLGKIGQKVNKQRNRLNASGMLLLISIIFVFLSYFHFYERQIIR